MTTVGVTSGASVPEVLVRGVLDFLSEYGYENVETINTAEETLTFALPRELRPARTAKCSRPGSESPRRQRVLCRYEQGAAS